MRTYLLLPAYNEELALHDLLPKALGVLNAEQIILVDDGSTDRTADVARAFGVTLLQHERNQGLAGAIRTLFRAAAQLTGPEDVIVTMDSDNTMNPAQIPEMLRAVQVGADIVIASRFVGGGSERGVPPLRRLYSRGTRLLFQTQFPIPGVRDYTCGYRAYRAGLLHAYIRDYPRLFESRGFTAQTEMLFNLSRYRPVVQEIPLELRYDLKGGGSKMNVTRTIREYLELGFRTRQRQRTWEAHAPGLGAPPSDQAVRMR